jgi:O-antigen ligase
VPYGLAVILISGGYFLGYNLSYSTKMQALIRHSTIISSIPVSFYGIISYYKIPIPSGWLDPSFHGVISGRATSFFSNPNIFASYLMIVVIFSILSIKSEKRALMKGIALASAILSSMSLILTYTRGAWLGLSAAFVLYLLPRVLKKPKALLIIIPTLLFLPLLLPNSIVMRIFSIFDLSDSSSVTRFYLWENSLKILRDNFWIGIGPAPEAFYNRYSLIHQSVYIPPHSHSTPLEIFIRGGIFGGILFLWLIISKLRAGLGKGRGVNSAVAEGCNLLFISLLVYGITDFIFYSYPLFFLITSLTGFGSALLKDESAESPKPFPYIWQ